MTSLLASCASLRAVAPAAGGVREVGLRGLVASRLAGKDVLSARGRRAAASSRAQTASPFRRGDDHPASSAPFGSASRRQLRHVPLSTSAGLLGRRTRRSRASAERSAMHARVLVLALAAQRLGRARVGAHLRRGRQNLSARAVGRRVAGRGRGRVRRRARAAVRGGAWRRPARDDIAAEATRGGARAEAPAA